MLPIFRTREDKLNPYFRNQLGEFVFTELSAAFLRSSGFDFLEGVPVPVEKQDLKGFINGGVSTTKIADNMAVVIGSDTHFKFAEQYLRYLNKMFSADLVKVFASKAEEAFKIGSFRKAIAYLRAGMMFREEDLTAIYAYACGCRWWYLSLEGSEEDQELIKILKDEAALYFDGLTSMYPEFAMGWYYLGYTFINAGKYLKAQIAWQHFLKAAEADQQTAGAAELARQRPDQTAGFAQPEPDTIKEIQDRLAELEDPVKIEHGAALLEAGHTMEALQILEPYVQTDYGKWWPLHYYLGMAYRELDCDEEAIEGFLNVLKLSPSNAEAMDNLADLYARSGDAEKSEKYRSKAALVRKQE